ncbi:hypothetical protein DSD19_19985 [Rhodovulum sp. BSW8]|uniref:MORN repeat protein n=1 Tax=Rhodovulum visakhapatnamense TaxID=364297 RepID=A0ABS1RK63_9RHOB|nr:MULTISPECIES: hypothetical protein [Rhodovulum]MBL3569270.1 hypothetical protein [Rhodovulum visakhapatnamense]MBL3580043.1 hypothetical protein [Rhodovulum visakhapatnamense]OLS44004.1 hypothetical protein BV509_06370 [Rhodovulum sulfidophilum]RBO51398.1 hypothetical protein DSD19_19985 [Rhodovulum sp. BSW8]
MRLAPTALILAATLAVPAAGAPAADAAEPMSATAFDRYATGKTLFYASDGHAYGAEQYLSGRRVIWTFLDGECSEGVWYESNGQICFRYEHDPEDPQCWSFFESGGGLMARFENDPAQTELVEVNQSREPLMCTGPDVGA